MTLFGSLLILSVNQSVFPSPNGSSPRKKSNSLGPPCEFSFSVSCSRRLRNGSFSDVALSAPVCPLTWDCASGVTAAVLVFASNGNEAYCGLAGGVAVIFKDESERNGENPKEDEEKVGSNRAEADMSPGRGKMDGNCEECWLGWKLSVADIPALFSEFRRSAD